MTVTTAVKMVDDRIYLPRVPSVSSLALQGGLLDSLSFTTDATVGGAGARYIRLSENSTAILPDFSADLVSQCVPKRCDDSSRAFPVGVVDTCGTEIPLPPHMHVIDARLKSSGVIDSDGGIRVDQTCRAYCFPGFSFGEVMLSQMDDDFDVERNFTYGCAGRVVDGVPVETVCDAQNTPGGFSS